jgi:hypothetical protein
MPGRNRVPSFQLASGTTNERDNSYNLTTVGNIFYNTDTSNVEIYRPVSSNAASWNNLVHNSIGTTITEQVQQHIVTSSEPRNLHVYMSTSSQSQSNETLKVGNDPLYITLTSKGIWSIQVSILVGTVGADVNSKKQIDQFMIGLGDNDDYPNLGGDGTSHREDGVAWSGGGYNSNKNYRTITITYVNNVIDQKIYLFSFIHVRSTSTTAQQVTTTLSTQPEGNFNFMKAIKIAILP